MLASCMCNLVPVKESEQEHALATALGFYAPAKDTQGRDYTFGGPASSSKTGWKGGAKFKSSLSPLTSKQMSEVVSELLEQDLDVNVCMVHSISTYNPKACIRERNHDTEWLVLQLIWGRWEASTEAPRVSKQKREAGSRGEAETVKPRKILMIMEIGRF
ncbi:hypothetical protein GUITHDRAFT_153032 [Guillardia theta CCMP2712]|uniref:Uncharacterized protein n=1 Tax=Guillardia theta (strain CCMP2712) TaxID=905079 RepID=L1J738_GUITC|nr:hypothetical protein GUITHDRAFT_153032 [Guillardia theta CCMP2712]EKX44348.1 hypothetical protein GUITHDRAFT_153032 [Guillardia theta CCMP2712]|eukprot:XP_005831328.1 hypothetical protein GUITHDRAFT_153032 [Guillardia theta CCMP2712]